MLQPNIGNSLRFDGVHQARRHGGGALGGRAPPVARGAPPPNSSGQMIAKDIDKTLIQSFS